MDTFLEKYNLPKLNEEEAENLNGQITTDEIESVIKKLPAHKSSGPDGFTGKFYQIFKEFLSSQTIPKIQEEGKLQNSFYKSSIILIPKSGKAQQRKKITGQYL